jgi:hypothetical protein
MAEQATSRSGKPINVGDQVTIVGTVTAVAAATGLTTVVTVKGLFSNVTLSPQAGDCYSAHTG